MHKSCLALSLLLLSAPAFAGPFEVAIEKARRAEKEFEANPKRVKLRHHNEKLISYWQDAVRAAKSDDKRNEALRGELRATERMSRWSGLAKDEARVDELERKLKVASAPKSKIEKREAQAKAPKPKTEAKPKMEAKAQPIAGARRDIQWLSKVPIEIEGERFSAILPTTAHIQWKKHVVAANKERGLRVYFDISPVVAGLPALQTVDVEHARVTRMRVGQFDADTVRIVLDLDKGAALPELIDLIPGSPPRIVVGPGSSGEPIAEATEESDEGESNDSEDAAANDALQAVVDEIRKEAAIKVDEFKDKVVAPIKKSTGIGPQVVKIRKVVIDAGHGGKDTGAIGCSKKLEKDVNLRIAKKLGKALKEQLGVQIIYTRTSDEFVSLRRRVEIANQADGDLFVSIHANSHRSRNVHGIETYYLNTTTSRYATRLANRENSDSDSEPIDGPDPEVGVDAADEDATPKNRLGRDVQLLLAELAMKSATDQSRQIAGLVQNSIVTSLGRSHEIRDLGVKRALFYVLLGARMPSILIETGFMSHPTEGKRLASGEYQDRMAAAIAKAVGRYIRERNEIASRI